MHHVHVDRYKKMAKTAIVILTCFMVVSCSKAEQPSIPTPTSFSTSRLAAPATTHTIRRVTPTYAQPTIDLVQNIMTPAPTVPIRPSPMSTKPMDDTLLNTKGLTQEPSPTATTEYIPTATKEYSSIKDTFEISPVDFSAEFPEIDYILRYSSIITGPDGIRYGAFILTDPSIDPDDLSGERTGPEVCRLAVYRWEDRENVMIGTFPAATYPQMEDVYPFGCTPVDWDEESYSNYDDLTDKERRMLKMNHAWSDVNQNGWPEFAIWYGFCDLDCWTDTSSTIQFYEIQEDSTVVNITAGLPGPIIQSRISHKGIPGTLYVVNSRYVEKFYEINTFWIYSWNGSFYEDVTLDYVGDFLEWGENKLVEIRQEYGTPIE